MFCAGFDTSKFDFYKIKDASHLLWGKTIALTLHIDFISFTVERIVIVALKLQSVAFCMYIDPKENKEEYYVCSNC